MKKYNKKTQCHSHENGNLITNKIPDQAGNDRIRD